MPTARTSAGWNDAVVCANGIRNGLPEKNVQTIVPTTIAPAANGATALSAGVRVTYDGDRVVGIQGFAQTAVGGAELQLDFGVPQSVLRPRCDGFPAVAVSAAGPVYPFTWNDQPCDNAACTSSHSTASGTGCFAATQQGGELVTTIQFGSCTPSAFPSIPPLAGVAVKKGLLDGLLVRVTARSGAYTFRNDCGPQLFLNGYTTWTQVVRPRPGLTVSGGSQLALVPIIFTADGASAKDWGGQVDLGLTRAGSGADPVKLSFRLTDFAQRKAPVGWGCGRKGGHGQSLDDPLPVYVWGGQGGKTYVGRAWIRVLGKDGQTADSHTGGAWSALIAFGTKDFSGA